MLTLTTKKYEVEEPIKATNENEETVYEFIMQLTSEEVKRINEIIINTNDFKKAKKMAKLDVLSEEYEKLEQEMTDDAVKHQEELENICFKDHKEPFKTAVGEYKYLEMVEMIFDFFWNAFIEKKAKRANTMTSGLRKIGGQ